MVQYFTTQIFIYFIYKIIHVHTLYLLYTNIFVIQTTYYPRKQKDFIEWRLLVM